MASTPAGPAVDDPNIGEFTPYARGIYDRAVAGDPEGARPAREAARRVAV